MKKMFLIIAATFFVVFSANAQYFQVDTARLNTAYRELVDNPDSDEKQEAFFYAFPDNWKEFITTYGFCSKDGYDLTMYSAAYEHIAALGSKISFINDTAYCRKLVNIAVGGVYGADAPNYFKTALHRTMREKEGIVSPGYAKGIKCSSGSSIGRAMARAMNLKRSLPTCTSRMQANIPI